MRNVFFTTFPQRLLCGASVIILSLTQFAWALPQNGNVKDGDINIQTPAAAQMTVKQTTDKGIIHWDSFNINKNETVTFIQPNANSLTVNKVIGNDPSLIFGSLNANGKIMLLNQNGILFGPDSKVDVGGLVASTLDLNEASLGDLSNVEFNPGSKSDAAIVNAGSITAADGGLVALVAPGVANMGIIKANLGNVNLLSGKSTVLDLNGDGLISIEMADLNLTDAEASLNDTKLPMGIYTSKDSLIDAEGGQVYVTAAFAKQVINSAINISALTENKPVIDLDGTIKAENNGRIIIHAGSSKNGFDESLDPSLNGLEYGDEKIANEVKISGHISTKGSNAATNGGKIVVSGQHIHLENGSTLDARGTADSGYIAIGSNDNFVSSISGSAHPIDGTVGVNITQSPIATSVLIGAEAEQIVNAGDEDNNIAITAYVEAYEGNVPLVMLSGHDGAFAPGHYGGSNGPENAVLANDEKLGPSIIGGKGRDTFTHDIAMAAYDDLANAAGMPTDAKPYLFKFNIMRSHVDVNRSYLKASEKNQAMHAENWTSYENGNYNLGVDAYKSWHILIDQATKDITQTHGEGYLLDIHGFASDDDPQVVGGLDNPDDDHIDNFDSANAVEILLGFGALDYNDILGLNSKAKGLLPGDPGYFASGKSAFQYAVESTIYNQYASLSTGLTEQEKYELIYDLIMGEKSFVHALKSTTDTVDFDSDTDGIDIFYTPLPNNLPKPDNSGFDAPEANIEHFYQGGFNVDAHGSGIYGVSPEPYDGGTVSGLQIELPSHLRKTTGAPELFGSALATAGSAYLQNANAFPTINGTVSSVVKDNQTDVQTASSSFQNNLLSNLPTIDNIVDAPPALAPVAPLKNESLSSSDTNEMMTELADHSSTEEEQMVLESEEASNREVEYSTVRVRASLAKVAQCLGTQQQVTGQSINNENLQAQSSDQGCSANINVQNAQ
ncbi:filamentous hemagglutinin N-terminal domain-containing protein [Curvivirga sp.]|uniref:two-partner secretion domain-containing protein n=1 Tax=Curvivirga sp. TaxID=2856848 RepID=UPI003B58F109